MNADYGRNTPYSGCWFRAWRAFWITLPQPCKVMSPSWPCNWVFKKPFHHSWCQLLQESGEPGKTSEWIPCTWTQCRISFAIKFLDQCKAVWNTIRVDKVFCKSTVGSFGRSSERKEGKLYPEYLFSKDKTLTLPRWKLSNIINLSPVLDWSPWRIIPYQSLSVGFCYWLSTQWP